MSAVTGTSLSSSLPHASGQNLDKENKNLNIHAALPAFALKHAAVAVSLSSSASSELSVPEEVPAPNDTTPHAQQLDAAARDTAAHNEQASELLAGQQATGKAPQPGQQPTVLQLLSQLDSIKWENVANWASQDSAQAALCDRLVPLMAESLMDQDQGGSDSITRLELQVARKKLEQSNEQLQAASQQVANLQTQVAELSASQASLLATKETNGHATQMEQAQAACQLQSAQQRLADAETAAADAEQKLRQTQTEHTSHLRQVAEQHSSLLRDVESSHETQLKARLKKLSQQHSEALSQMQGSHEAQAKLAQQHHEALLKAHTQRLEQQYQAQAETQASQHASDIKQKVASLLLDHQQQLRAQADKQSSQQEAHVIHTKQLLEQAQASLAAEKQRSAALKAQLKREGKQGANTQDDLHSQLSCLQSRLDAAEQSLEDEKRRGSKALREARATAETDLVKVKQAVATAEQQRQEVTKQAECDAHRAAIKLTQANKSCKAAKQEASDAHKRVEESEKAARQTQEQLMQASAAVAGLQDELQALKARLASQATAEQAATLEKLHSTQEQLHDQSQQHTVAQSVLRSISRALPPGLSQQNSQLEAVGRGELAMGAAADTETLSLRPERVLEQLQSFVHTVQADEDRWQNMEEQLQRQLQASRAAQEGLEQRVRQECELRVAGEADVARQRQWIQSIRADMHEKDHAVHVSAAQVQDAKAAQASAEHALATLRAEFTHLSSQVSAAHELASMWQGRAEGMQQQLDQRLPWQGRAEGLAEQLEQATARAECMQQQLNQATAQLDACDKATKEHLAAAALQEDRIRELEAIVLEQSQTAQQVAMATASLEQQLALSRSEAAAAQGLLQQLSLQLEAQTSKVNAMTHMFQLLLQSVTSSSTVRDSQQQPPSSVNFAASTANSAIVHAKPGAGQDHSASLPDQDTAAVVLSHVQHFVSTCQEQDAQLSKLSESLQTHLAEAESISTLLHAAMQQACLHSNACTASPERADPSTSSCSTQAAKLCDNTKDRSILGVQAHDVQQPRHKHGSTSAQGEVRSSNSVLGCEMRQDAAQLLQAGALGGGGQPSLRLAGLRQNAEAAAQHMSTLSTRLQQNESQVRGLAEQLQLEKLRSAESQREFSQAAHKLTETEHSLHQVQAKAAAKTAAMKMRLKAASQTIAAANEHKLQQDSQLMQLQTDLQEATSAKAALRAQVSDLSTALAAMQDSAATGDKEQAMLKQQLLALHAASASAQTDAKQRQAQLELQLQQLQNSSKQQSVSALELTAHNSGLSTQLDLLQSQHAQQLNEVESQTAAPLQKQIASLQQQLRSVAKRVEDAEQQLSAQDSKAHESESRAARAESLVRRVEERKSSLEADKRRLQQSVKELKTEVTVWEHKCFSLQEGATTAQTALMQCRKEAAASSAAAISTQQLLQQLQEAGSALADSHSSAQKLHQQLQQAQQANAQLKQQLAETSSRCTSAEQKLQHLQAASDSVLLELESTREAVSSRQCCSSGTDIRGISIAQSLAHSVPPATDDAKAERIRQLHHTLSEIIDERNDLRDQLETLSQSDLATELEQAECEILYLREQVESAQ